VTLVALNALSCGAAVIVNKAGHEWLSSAVREGGARACARAQWQRAQTARSHPPKVLLVGDSIMDGILVDGNGRASFEAHGWVVASSAHRGFGLLDNAHHEYVQEMRFEMATFRPQVVVFEFVGNYRAFGEAGIPGLEPDTPAFFRAWEAEASRVTEQAVAGGARVYWVLGPAIAWKEWNARVHTIAAGYKRLSAVHPNVQYINAFKLLGDPWEPGPLRRNDGIHPTVVGSTFLADAVLPRVLSTVWPGRCPGPP